jgi:hypothetical protein
MSARSETTIFTDDNEVKLLYTNRALANAEKLMGKSVIQVAQGFADGESGITEMAMLLQAGMAEYKRDARVGGKPITVEDAYDVMDSVGFTEVAQVVMEAIAEVLVFAKEKSSKN